MSSTPQAPDLRNELITKQREYIEHMDSLLIQWDEQGNPPTHEQLKKSRTINSEITSLESQITQQESEEPKTFEQAMKDNPYNMYARFITEGETK